MADENESGIKLEYMTSTQKVAAFLIAMGPTTASEILKNIKDTDLLEQITLDIASLHKISTDMLNSILDEFHALFIASDYVQSGGMSYAQTLLEKAYGTEQAEKIKYEDDLFKNHGYTRDFVKALNSPFGYNIPRFKNLSIEQLFDRNEYLTEK